MPAKIKLPNTDYWIEQYANGMSENQISKQLGIARHVIRRILLSAGVKPRNQYESETVKWALMSSEKRAAQVAAAHAATAGRIPTFSEKEQRAKANQVTMKHASPIERTISAGLTDRGFDITQQLASGVYNFDIFIHTPPVVVEVNGGGWHSNGDHFRRGLERSKYILDEMRLSLLVIWVDGRKYPFGEECYGEIISFCNFVSKLPAGQSVYRVVLGNGDLAPACRSKLNSRAIVEGFGCRFDDAGGYHILTG